MWCSPRSYVANQGLSAAHATPLSTATAPTGPVECADVPSDAVEANNETLYEGRYYYTFFPFDSDMLCFQLDPFPTKREEREPRELRWRMTARKVRSRMCQLSGSWHFVFSARVVLPLSPCEAYLEHRLAQLVRNQAQVRGG